MKLPSYSSTLPVRFPARLIVVSKSPAQTVGPFRNGQAFEINITCLLRILQHVFFLLRNLCVWKYLEGRNDGHRYDLIPFVSYIWFL